MEIIGACICRKSRAVESTNLIIDPENVSDIDPYIDGVRFISER